MRFPPVVAIGLAANATYRCVEHVMNGAIRERPNEIEDMECKILLSALAYLRALNGIAFSQAMIDAEELLKGVEDKDRQAYVDLMQVVENLSVLNINFGGEIKEEDKDSYNKMIGETGLAIEQINEILDADDREVLYATAKLIMRYFSGVRGIALKEYKVIPSAERGVLDTAYYITRAIAKLDENVKKLQPAQKGAPVKEEEIAMYLQECIVQIPALLNAQSKAQEPENTPSKVVT